MKIVIYFLFIYIFILLYNNNDSNIQQQFIKMIVSDFFYNFIVNTGD